ncbi:hypothetical protein XENTR_v10002800 [Xenopus tropicalis]|uniref:Cocaine- and amphetamine-regulated transcript protein n=2 Tax=Xenopus tropicalis TaxID=8364 RepID=A0A6I8PSB8_XENTR|nr:cocaine- and amphetamine-regulated transcript protein [Xenopus tropicalis]KAE8635974.1 hypothetical protein XENTR_v10002800 [Xenopus tropicalis]|eukprot:XP_002934864.1 PREDICTED: cocaine- and amphetamine-regulated transcript protein [Xenopus tropicalis]
MESARLHLLLWPLLLLLSLSANCQEDSDSLETRAADFFSQGDNSVHEKDLIDALQEVLEKLKNKRLPLFEKKYGQVPMCDAGEQCAVRKGPRIGKLCDCPRRTSCNTFLLKCL